MINKSNNNNKANAAILFTKVNEDRSEVAGGRLCDGRKGGGDRAKRLIVCVT